MDRSLATGVDTEMGRLVRTETRIAAPVAVVWRALTDPDAVRAWDGAEPYAVPPGYPQPGQHARWRIRLAGLPATLHDRIRAVEPEQRLASRLSIGPFVAQEEYRLHADDTGAATTVVLSLAGSRILTRPAPAALRRLKEWCETAVHG